MISKFKYFVISLGLIAGFGLLSPLAVGAQSNPANLQDQCASEEAKKTDACKNIGNADLTAFINTVVNGLLYVLGAMSVLVLVIAGIFYTTSMGDESIIKKAKNALIYSIIGLIVAVLSYAIVNFVIGAFN
jgi:hypothetical protein